MRLEDIFNFEKETKYHTKREILKIIEDKELRHKDLLFIADYNGLGLMSRKNKKYLANVIAEHYSGGIR